jgi:hypothetical protein
LARNRKTWQKKLKWIIWNEHDDNVITYDTATDCLKKAKIRLIPTGKSMSSLLKDADYFIQVGKMSNGGNEFKKTKIPLCQGDDDKECVEVDVEDKTASYRPDEDDFKVTE